jgi:hypothetical protein
MAPEFHVVHLQMLHASASLAPPAIALQYLSMELTIALRIERESGAFAVALFHDAFPVTSERKASRCGTGKNL